MNNNPASAVYQLCDYRQITWACFTICKRGTVNCVVWIKWKSTCQSAETLGTWLEKTVPFETFLQVPQKPTIYFVTQVISFPRHIIYSHFLIGIICKEGKAWNNKQGDKQWAIRWETQTHEVLSSFIDQWNTGFPRAAFLKAGFENGFKLCRKGILHRQKELRSLALKGGFNTVNHKILSQRNFFGGSFFEGGGRIYIP